jgi:hypothetical protein
MQHRVFGSLEGTPDGASLVIRALVVESLVLGLIGLSGLISCGCGQPS